MGGRAPSNEEDAPLDRTVEWGTACGLFLLLFLLLLSNGRPIGAGDTRPTERVAASLVQERDFDLDEYPEVTEPFARAVGEHRVSIYPVLSAVLAAPLFAAAAPFVTLDETATAVLGKLAASFFSALAAALLFLAVSHRRLLWGKATAVAFALGTTVWSTSQALWQHPAAVMFLCLGLLWLSWAEDDERWVGPVGFALSAMVAARHADVALGAVATAIVLLRWPRQAVRFALCALPMALFVLGYDWALFGSPLAHGFSGQMHRFSEAWGAGHLGLLLSPARGLFVFSPIVLVGIYGLVRAWRQQRDEGVPLPVLPLLCAAGAVAHWLLVGRWAEWHGGQSWGPRLLTDALPLLFFFLPEGLDRLPRAGYALIAASIGVQALGAFAYDYRWEKLAEAPEGSAPRGDLWSVADGPIPFYLRRGVFILAAPGVSEDKALVREHPLVLPPAQGSEVSFGGENPALSGDALVEDVHLQRGARQEGGKLHLRGRWDGLFLRVVEKARPRALELRVTGTGTGTLYVAERSFWAAAARFKAYPVSGRFSVSHRYDWAQSGGEDLLVTTGRAPGDITIDRVAMLSRAGGLGQR